MELSPGLRWSLHRGETDPILGWYSPALGHRVPVFTLLGRGRSEPGAPLTTRLEFLDTAKSSATGVPSEAISWSASAAKLGEALEMQVEA